jgi:MoxR-like ATPase
MIHSMRQLDEKTKNTVGEIQRKHAIVGREKELALALAILRSNRHLLLEGPVGVGKTTVALALTRHIKRETFRVDGDERYTENKLTGWFDPPLVLKMGYHREAFFTGPLVQAMTEGGVLFINELNRMPESVQNVLLPTLDEGAVILPRIGEVRAKSGFQVIATQNPVDYVATGHLSEALKDRFEHVVLDYQSETEEMAIVAEITGCRDEDLIQEAVLLTRATRIYPQFEKGASIRAAIAIVEIAQNLGGEKRLLDSALAALATRVELRDDESSSLRDVLESLIDAFKKKD